MRPLNLTFELNPRKLSFPSTELKLISRDTFRVSASRMMIQFIWNLVSCLTIVSLFDLLFKNLGFSHYVSRHFGCVSKEVF